MKKFNFSTQTCYDHLPTTATVYLKNLAHINTSPKRNQAQLALLALCGERISNYFPGQEIDHAQIWVSHVFDQVGKAILVHDAQAMAIACDLIELDPHLPFGKLIKSNLARRLKRITQLLSPRQRQQIITTSMKLLALPFAPRELEDYVRLLARFDKNTYWVELLKLQTLNPKANHLKAYLLSS